MTMRAEVLESLFDHILSRGQFPEVDRFNLTIRDLWGKPGRAALAGLVAADVVRVHAGRYWPYWTSLNHIPLSKLTAIIDGLRAVLREVQSAFREHPGKVVQLEDIQPDADVDGFPALVVLIDRPGTSVHFGQETGLPDAISASEGVLDIDVDSWPGEWLFNAEARAPVEVAVSPSFAGGRPVNSEREGEIWDLACEWVRQFHVEHWRQVLASILGTHPSLRIADYEAWVSGNIWLEGRILDDHPVETSLCSFRTVLVDFIVEFETVATVRERPPTLRVEKSYKLKKFENHEKWNAGARDWERSINRIGNLALELTRAANAVADSVRTNLDPKFLRDIGWLGLDGPLDENLYQHIYRPKYRDGEQYPGKDKFWAGEYLARELCLMLPGDESKIELNDEEDAAESPEDSPADGHVAVLSDVEADAIPSMLTIEGDREHPVLFLLATPRELRAVRAALSEEGVEAVESAVGNRHVLSFALQGRAVNWRVTVGLATTKGPHAAQALLNALASATGAQLAVLVGVCGGFPEHGARADTVVVANSVFNYEPARVRSGSQILNPTGYKASARVVAGAQWLKGSANEDDFHLVIKDYASGEKLIDDLDAPLRKRLLAFSGDLVGFEMEGHGALHAAWERQSEHPEFQAAMVKGVSDFGDGEMSSDKDSRQHLAGIRACRVALELLRLY